MPQLRLALAQVNAVVGDIDHNVELVVSACHDAARAGAHLVVFPEMVLTGYPVEDLAGRLTFIRRCQEAVAALPARLAEEGLGDLVVVVGHLDSAKPREVEAMTERLGVPKNAPTNSASVINSGRIVARYDKHHLPNYGVFDEFRNFVPGEEVQIVQVHGVDVAIAICEDIWQDGPSAAAKAAEAGLLLVLNGSPYEAAKDDARLELCARRAREGGCALAYVNLVGGQDELVFDGDSLVVGADGELVARAAQFVPELLVADLELAEATAPMPEPGTRVQGLLVNRVVVTADPLPAYPPVRPTVAQRWDDLGERYQAIVLGLRDYVQKNRFGSVLLGLSGGI
uniref:nitrilase-related carbon-nitrogen hydrolase n=1 Tax=uncultured Aeromicrobium sp. TaxID=337820 RepID=UPI0025F2F49E